MEKRTIGSIVLKEPFVTTKMLKLTRAQICEESSGTRPLLVVFLFSDHCIKQTDSMLQWVCSVIRICDQFSFYEHTGSS